MRDYGKVAPQFWTGKTGKEIKAGGSDAVVVAMYLMTSPHANMIGIYYLPMLYLAHETGLTIEGASEGLRRCVEAGFCTFEADSDYVFVHSMARYQVGENLQPNDNRVKGVANELSKVSQPLLRKAFIDIYAAHFHLKKESPLEAPCKPLRSQEQEQEQEQKQEQEKKKKSAPALPDAVLFPDVNSQVIADFKKLRKAKKAEITETAMAGIVREAGKAGYTLEAALKTCCERGWSAFKADWVQQQTAEPASRQRRAL